MVRQPDEHITFPEPPEAITGIRRLNSFLRIGAVSAVLAAAFVGAGRSSSAAPGSTCSSLASAEVLAVLDEIASLQASEAAIRRRLAGPGLIIPRQEDMETYR